MVSKFAFTQTFLAECFAIRTLLVCTLVTFFSACAGHNKIEFRDAIDEPAFASEIESTGPEDIRSDRPTPVFIRRSVAVAQAGILLTRSFQVDPINRPVSNALALGSYALKSTTGMLRRVAHSTTQFPALENTPIPQLTDRPGMDLQKWEHDLDKISGEKSSTGTIQFLIDGGEYFPRMLDSVSNAKESIDIRTYIFDNDDFAVLVADTIKEKSKDVDVRVMVDGLGNLLAMQADPETLPENHNAPLSMELYLEQNSKVSVRSLSNPWLTGDHTKTTIVDGKTAFVGGMNIGREYRYEWHDVMMEVRGPIVNKLQRDTEKAWAKASLLGDVANLYAFLFKHPRKASAEGYPVRTLYTKTFDSQIYRAQLAAIRRSSSYIWIENAYFSDDTIMYELAKARRRGVDVRVILPDAGNHAALEASNKVAINKMLKNGIRVYRYPGMSHVKASVIDGWLCVGTANFDKLSLQVNKELNLSTSYQPVVQELLMRVFIPDFERSQEILHPEDISIPARLAEIWVDEML